MVSTVSNVSTRACYAAVLFVSIIEFNNTDGSSVYTPGKSTIVSEYNLEDNMKLSAKKLGAGFDQGLNSWGWFHMKSSLVSENGTKINDTLFDLQCAHANYNHTVNHENRSFKVDAEDSKCDVDFAGFPVKDKNNTHLAVKTATIGMQFEYSMGDDEYDDDEDNDGGEYGDDDGGSDSFTVGGVTVGGVHEEKSNRARRMKETVRRHNDV